MPWPRKNRRQFPAAPASGVFAMNARQPLNQCGIYVVMADSCMRPACGKVRVDSMKGEFLERTLYRCPSRTSEAPALKSLPEKDRCLHAFSVFLHRMFI